MQLTDIRLASIHVHVVFNNKVFELQPLMFLLFLHL